MLLAAGAAAYVAAAVLLLALRAGLADAAEDPRFALAAEQKFFRALRVILTCLLAESALCFLLLLAGSNNRLGGTLTAGALLLCALAAYALTASIEARRAAALAEGTAQRSALRDKKLAVRLFSVCEAVLAALLIAACILSSSHPTVSTPLVSGSAQEVLTHMHTLVWEEEYNLHLDTDIPAGEYVLDLSDINEEVLTPVGSGFWAQRLENEAWIFASDSEASLPEGGESTISSDVQISQFILSAPFLGYTADGREVYSVRYGDMGLGGMVSIPVDVQYRFTESEGVYTVVEVRTYTVEDLVGGIYLAASCVGSAAMLILWNALRSRQKFAV